MGKIELDLTELVQDKKGNIIWKKNIGEMIPFELDGEIDYIKIVDYNRQHITLEFNDKRRKFHETDLYYNHIEPLLGIYTHKFEYEVGDIIDGYKVIEQIFIIQKIEKTSAKYLEGKQENKYRGYKLECLNCGADYEVKQRSILNSKKKLNNLCACQKEAK